MRVLFVYPVVEDRGSARDIDHYARTATSMGHEVFLFGRPRSASPLRFSTDVSAADAVVFVFEWTTRLLEGDFLDLAHLVAHVPRRRRIVIDCDGKYNEVIRVPGDANHAADEESRRWIEICDSLSDKIGQPTLHPRRANVRPFLFHAYAPPTSIRRVPKDFDIVYVGNNWFRWGGLHRFLSALEPVRERIGRITIVGHGWNRPAPWSDSAVTDSWRTEPAYLAKMGIEVQSPVHFSDVQTWMGRGVCNPVIYRPLFGELGLVTCRTFETPAADTVPLFDQQVRHVREIFGEEAAELCLGAAPAAKVLDVLLRREHYGAIVNAIRHQLATLHSYEARWRELMEWIAA